MLSSILLSLVMSTPASNVAKVQPLEIQPIGSNKEIVRIGSQKEQVRIGSKKELIRIGSKKELIRI